MNSGLYALAGASATATAAACANRLPEPMTNVSKVYFGLSRAGSIRVLRTGRPPASGAARSVPGWVSSATASGPRPPPSAPSWPRAARR